MSAVKVAVAADEERVISVMVVVFSADPGVRWGMRSKAASGVLS